MGDLQKQNKTDGNIVIGITDFSNNNDVSNNSVISENIVTNVKQTSEKPNKNAKIPDILIIVPYRDREPQRFAFMKIMPAILEDKNYKIVFVHQRDKRPFNRGAIKNIGFLWAKQTYPLHYKDMTLVFHDIDTMPWYKNQFSYETTKGTINHFYGFKRALGGIFAIKGSDFEEINGFPNIWTWGLEDNIIQNRAINKKKQIIYPDFVQIEKENTKIIGLWHGWDRIISGNIQEKLVNDNNRDGINTLSNVKFSLANIEGEFDEINVSSFTTNEPLSSKFVRYASKLDSRQFIYMNKKPYFVRPRPKIGTSGTFGKRRGKNGFGSMVFN